MMTTRSSIVSAALSTLIVALRCGTSPSESFLIDVNAAGAERHSPASPATATATASTTSRHRVERAPNHRRPAVRVPTTTTTTSSSSSTRLSMIAKSGGRLIVSAEQFELEVLSTGGGRRRRAGRRDGGGGGGGEEIDADVGGLPSAAAAADVDDDDDDDVDVPVLVLFTAPWCGPCRLTSPVVGEILAQYRGRISVLEMSTDDLPDVAMDAGVRSIPTILIYYRGEVRDTIVGCVARNVLARAVDKVLEDLGRL
ncbi:hypothetical protein ACHAW5_009952 [Stephanodiscus triporus]|uniref:Thioredoxin domain-containing protein n=1 Tax=Stephanodiscus triporus TaxID=2934178 RepID=A0ABD3NNL0_9STRA